MIVEIGFEKIKLKFPVVLDLEGVEYFTQCLSRVFGHSILTQCGVI